MIRKQATELVATDTMTEKAKQWFWEHASALRSKVLSSAPVNENNDNHDSNETNSDAADECADDSLVQMNAGMDWMTQ